MVYKHTLHPSDLPRRLKWQPRFLLDVLIGDEATFTMTARINSHNVECYALQGNPPSRLVIRPSKQQRENSCLDWYDGEWIAL